MGRRILLILWTLAAAVGAYFLRAGDLSLPIFAHYEGIALWTLLGIALLLTALLALPEKGGWQFSELRPLPLAIALQGSGALLICVSAAWQLYRLFPVLRSFAAIIAATLLLSGLGLFGGMAACSKSESKAGSLLLLPLAASAFHLIAAYRETASDPHLSLYDMRILFLAAVGISMALLSDFVFTDGKRRLTLVFLSLTVTLAGTQLPSTDSLPHLLAIMGIVFSALGYLMVLLFGFEQRRIVSYELVEDPFSTGRVPRAPRDASEESTPAEVPSSLPAEELTSAPHPEKSEDAFDLSRVDRLLLELGLDEDIE